MRWFGGARLLVLSGLLLAAPPASAQAPAPTPLPEFPPDEKDFEGLTSLSLGSGARAFGMGGAFLARADDATAASWNPAGLSYLRRLEVSLVGVRNSFGKGPRGQSPEDTLVGYTPDFLAVAYPLERGAVSGAVQLSVQRVFSFAGKRTIDTPDFFFRTDGEGGFDILALGTGLRAARSLRVGMTLNRWFNGYRQSRLKQAGLRRQRQEIDYELTGWNVNLGVLWTPLETLNFGAVGKTGFTGRLDLRRDRTDFFGPLNTPESITTNTSAGTGVRLEFPGSLGVGVSWRPRSAMTLSADYTRTFWSSGRIRGFFTLPQTPLGQERPPPEVYPSLPYPTLDDASQKDTEQLRVGGEHVFIGERIKWPVRLGLFTDRQYFRALSGRAPRFKGFTVGAGLLVGRILFDAAYVLERGAYEEPRGDVSTKTHRIFVSLIYRHGARS